jgi:hypothetical protein
MCSHNLARYRESPHSKLNLKLFVKYSSHLRQTKEMLTLAVGAILGLAIVYIIVLEAVAVAGLGIYLLHCHGIGR